MSSLYACAVLQHHGSYGTAFSGVRKGLLCLTQVLRLLHRNIPVSKCCPVLRSLNSWDSIVHIRLCLAYLLYTHPPNIPSGFLQSMNQVKSHPHLCFSTVHRTNHHVLRQYPHGRLHLLPHTPTVPHSSRYNTTPTHPAHRPRAPNSRTPLPDLQPHS